MRRRLLFGKFDHIAIYRNGQPVDRLDINVGELIGDLEVFGVYKSGRQVKIKNSDCVWSADGTGVTVGADSGQVVGVFGSNTPVIVTAAYGKGGDAYEASVEFVVHLYTYKYFINANDDSTINCDHTTAVYGYTLYRTTYDNGTFVAAAETNDEISLTLVLTGDKDGSLVTTDKNITVSVESNKHSLIAKNYIGTFVLGGPNYEVETVNFGGYQHKDNMTIVHLADSSDSKDNVTTYGELSISLDKNSLNFPNTGETKSVTASTTQPYTITTYWTSDGAIKDVFSNTLTDEATFVWSGSLTPFSLNVTSGKTVNVTVGTTSSATDIERTLTVKAASTKDSTKTATATVSLVQISKSIVGYETISLKSATSTNPVVPAKGGNTSFAATYQQVVRWSDGTTTLVDIPSANVTYTQYSFNSLSTTPTTGETIVAEGISVFVTGLGDTPSTATFKYDARQAENKLVKTEYLVPTITYNGENPIIIPASGGSAVADTAKVTVSQKKRETYSSEESIEKNADVTGATKNATTVTATSLGTTSKPQTKVGDSKITVLVNGQIGTLDVIVEQAENIAHDGSKGSSISYSDWSIFFTNDVTTSGQDIYLDEKFGDDQYIEPDNANNTYNNNEEVYGEIGRMGETKDVHIRAVRTKSTKYFYSSGETCHIVKEPDYYGDTVKSGLTVTCNNGVSMGAVSTPNAQNVLTSTFPNPGSNHSLSKKSWTVTATLDGKTATKTISQTEGEIKWDDKTPSVVYTEAAPTEGAQSTHTAIDASMKWHWNDDTDKTTVTATASYELVGTVPSGTTINATTGVITWSKNESDSRSVTVKITLTANSGVAGDTSKVVSNEVTATQKSGLAVDHYTITGYTVEVNSETRNIGAAGGSFGISKSGCVSYTETYVSGTISSVKTKSIPFDKISVAESGDTYGTFAPISWNGTDGTVSVSSHKIAVRNEQTVVYTPSVSDSDLRSLFDETVNTIGAADVTALSVSQAKNEKRGSVYDDVSLNPTSKNITFEATGGTIDTEVTASQTYYDYYSSYEDGDTVNGKTTLMNVTSFTFAEPVESGSYLDDFTASYQLIGGKHYVRVVANVNTSTSGKNGYSATMQVTGADNKKSNIVINASQNAGNETYKYFIIAGEDKNLAVAGTSADFTYKLYRTTYVSGVYMSCAEANGTVTGVYGDSISGNGSSNNGTMSKAVSSNVHNTTTKKYSVTFSIPNGTAQETVNFGGYTADYTQVITHLADSLDNSKTVVEYTDYNAWIGNASTSTSNVSPISFSKAGETRTLYGFSVETKTTKYYWASDSSEDVASRKVETLKNESTWSWSQGTSSDWTLSNKTSQNSSEAITANGTDSKRTIEVSLTATSKNKLTNSATAKSTMEQAAGLTTRYFIDANTDSSISAASTSATFGYTVIENSYDGAGNYLYSTIYSGSGVDVNVTYSGSISGTAVVTNTSRSVSKSIAANKHNETTKTYTASFEFADSSIQDDKNLVVVISGVGTYQEDKNQSITHLADTQTGGDDYEYSNPYVSVDNVIFDREGETKDITASPRVVKTTYRTWASDGTHSSVKSTETVGTNASDWNWSWELTDGNPFSIVSGYSSSNPTKVTVDENTSSTERVDTLTVTATLKADSSMQTSDYCTVTQEAGDVLEYITLELIDPANDGVIGYAENATYKVWAHFSASGDVDITNEATLYMRTTSTGSTSSPYISNPSNGRIVGNNAGEIIPGYQRLWLIAEKYSAKSIEDIDMTATWQYFTDGNKASSNQTVYLYATYGGMSTASYDGGRKTLVVEGQTANASTKYNETAATTAAWSFSVAEGDRPNAYLTRDTGSTNTLYPRGFGQYVVRVDSGSFYDTVTINVTRTENNITAAINDASDGFDINAEYATESNISLSVGFKNTDNRSYTATGTIYGWTSEVGAPLMTAGSTITSFSGTPTSDVMYNYTFTPLNESYVGIDLTVGRSSIVYNGSVPYKVELISSNGTRRDITSICPINAYTSTQYTTTSDAVTISSSEGVIYGNNAGSTLNAYNTLYVNPQHASIYIGGPVEITAYSKAYSEGRTSTSAKTIHFKATYMGFSDTHTPFTVGADSGASQTAGDPSTVSVNWTVSGGTLSAASGSSTTCTLTSSAGATVTAAKTGYIVETENDNVCNISPIAPTVVNLVVETLTKQIDYNDSSSLRSTIYFDDGTTKTYTTNPISYQGVTYVVEYENLDTSVPSSRYELDGRGSSVKNTNSGSYSHGAVTATATPSEGYTGDTFTLSIDGKSTWLKPAGQTIHIGGTIMKWLGGSNYESTGITDTDPRDTPTSNNRVVLAPQTGSDFYYTIEDWYSSNDNIITDTSATAGRFGTTAGTAYATVNYERGGGEVVSTMVELINKGQQQTQKTVTLVLDRQLKATYNANVSYQYGQQPYITMLYCAFNGLTGGVSINTMNYNYPAGAGGYSVTYMETAGQVNYAEAYYYSSIGASIDSLSFQYYDLFADSNGRYYDFDVNNSYITFEYNGNILGSIAPDTSESGGAMLVFRHSPIPLTSVSDGGTVYINMHFALKMR